MAERLGRQRASNSKTEAMLRRVEQHSLTDLLRLSTPLGWPSNPDDGAIALQIVFGLLESEAMPQEGPPESEEVAQRMMFVRHCVEVVMTSVGQLMSKTNDRAKDVYSPIYQENLCTYTRWLHFLARETTWVYDDHGNAALEFGPSFAGEALETMFSNGTLELRAFMRRSTDVIDLMLFLWAWRSADGRPMYIRYEVEGQSCPLVSLFSWIVSDAASVQILHQRVEFFTPQAHRAPIDGSLARLRAWKASRLQNKSSPPASDPIIVTNLMQFLLDIPPFAKAYVKSKFPSHALSTVKKFSDLLVRRASPGRELTPLPIAMGSTLFFADPGFRPAFLVHNVVLQLLDAGLLQVIVEDMLSQKQDTPYPFRAWGEGPEWHHGPLSILCSLGVNKAICAATVQGVSRLSERQSFSLTVGWHASTWSTFRICFRANEDAWKEAENASPTLCDNLSHHTRAASKDPRSLKCANCGMAVYCSPHCQREDWGAYHRTECPANRIYRIDRQLASSWVSHHNRMFYLGLLHHFVINYEVGNRPESNFDQVRCVGSVLIRGGGLLPGHADAERYRRLIIQFNTIYCPVKISPHSVEQTLEVKFKGKAVYDTPRWKKMFSEMEESAMRYGQGGGLGRGDGLRYRIRLATLASFAGEYRIFVTGRFVVGKSAERTTVEFLNGYVKVEKRSDWDG